MRVHRASRALLAAALALACLQPGGAVAQDPSGAPVGADADCAAAFGVADAILRAVAMTPGTAGRSMALGSVLLDLTITWCASAETWLAAVAAYPDILGDADPQATLATRCTDPAAALAGAPACAGQIVPAPRLVARPGIKPRVKGAQRTRYYAIRGLSPDELFTQMQVNGAAVCPTHAVACVTIQPVLRPLVTTGASCRVIGIQASLSVQASLPRWAGPPRVYPELAAWWRKVATRIGRHETQHIRIAQRHLARLRRDIVGRSCASLSSSVSRWSKRLGTAQDAFDAKELDRPWPDYDGPTP